MVSQGLRRWSLYLLLGVFAAGGYFFLPSVRAQNLFGLLIGTSAIVAILVGIRIHRPAVRCPGTCSPRVC